MAHSPPASRAPSTTSAAKLQSPRRKQMRCHRMQLDRRAQMYSRPAGQPMAMHDAPLQCAPRPIVHSLPAGQPRALRGERRPGAPAAVGHALLFLGRVVLRHLWGLGVRAGASAGRSLPSTGNSSQRPTASSQQPAASSCTQHKRACVRCQAHLGLEACALLALALGLLRRLHAVGVVPAARRAL
jgi:hypothetical protein